MHPWSDVKDTKHRLKIDILSGEKAYKISSECVIIALKINTL